jgi:hypothetical protein
MSFKTTLRTGTAAAFMLTAAATSAIAANLPALIPTNQPGIFAVPAPPATLDYVNASDATLAYYRVPPRPNHIKQPAAYAAWKRAMLLHPTRVQADLIPGPVHTHPQSLVRVHTASAKPMTSYLQFTNWSGFLDAQTVSSFSSTASFNNVSGDFNTPVNDPANCSGLEKESVWVGIDGAAGSPDLLQAGSDTPAQCNTKQTSYAWFEWFPATEQELNPAQFVVLAGDEMFIQVWATSATAGNAFIENIRTRTYSQYSFGPPSGTKLVGNTVEWINEAVTINGKISTMPCFKNIYFQSAAATRFSGASFNFAGPGANLVELVQNNAVVSVPVPTTSTAGYTYYK